MEVESKVESEYKGQRVISVVLLQYCSICYNSIKRNEVERMKVRNGEYMIKEFETLREEIKHKIELGNTIWMFGITTITTLLFVAIELGKRELLLLPYCIIIPIQLRIAYYSSAMLRLSTYIAVFLESEIEELNWETRINDYFIERKSNLFDKAIEKQRFFDIGALGFICSSLYLIKYCSSIDNNIGFWNLVINIAPAIILLGITVLILLRKGAYPNSRSDWMKEWKKIKDKES